ncbi:triose-phosphate isomerase [Pseudoramibacter alactolyticus]
MGIDILEIGHSERRQYFNETDYTVNQKVLAGLRHEFTTLICIGDSMQEKTYDVSAEVLARQLKIALHGVKTEDLDHIWVAYEPYWAIGVEGIPAEPPVVDKLHTYLRSVLIDLYGEKGQTVPLLFGGSVNINNAVPYAKCQDVDGLFIGRSAWRSDTFEAIMIALEEAGIPQR